MGCDVHFFVEHFKDGEWKHVEGKVAQCPDCNGTGEMKRYSKNITGPEPIKCFWCNGNKTRHDGFGK